MQFGWKRLLPLALATVLITAVIIVTVEEDVWTPLFDSFLSALNF
jgi:peptidoglycan/LPS O-acetylase OafA/YrhL